MGDEDYGMYSEYGMDSGSYSEPAYDPNSNTWDPASAYYQPTGWGDNYISPIDVPSGGGAYSVGGGDWQGIYAPSSSASAPTSYMSAGAYDAMRGAPPSSRTTGYGSPGVSSSGGSSYGFPSFSQPMGGGGGGGGSPGARAVAQQTPQMITLGKPEDDLYNRYKSLLMNPDFSNDPTYKFLYNQGLQALNRNLAAKRMSLSGQSMNDTMSYGAGMASKYMQDLLPQYRAGASEELQRFMGPASLLPRYAGVNNATISGANNMVNNADDRAMYRDMLANPGGGGGGMEADWGSGIGMGGMGSSYTTPPATAPARTGSPAPRPMSYNPNYTSSGDFDPYYNGYDLEGGGPAYG